MIKPLNYCRQLKKIMVDQLAAPSLPPERAAQARHIRDLCDMSQKFIVPDHGRVLDDNELRALDPAEPLHLPHTFIAIEFSVLSDKGVKYPGDERFDIQRSTRRIAFCRQDDAAIYVTVAFFTDADGTWTTLNEAIIDRADFIDPARSLPGSPCIKFSVPRGARHRDWADEIFAMLSLLNAMSCSNVHTEKIVQSSATKKTKAGLPFDDYHVLTVDINRTASQPGAPLDINRRSPREHLRRGHVVKPEGRRPFWRNATVVNAGHGYGKIQKDYAVIASAPRSPFPRASAAQLTA